MICIQCNKEFKAKRSDAKFCSDACRWAFNRKKNKNNEMPRTTISKGYVYLLRCKEYYKIGVTDNDVPKRIQSMKTGNPFLIQIIFMVKVKEPFELEKAIHTCFKSSRMSGEWFSLDDDDLSVIIKIMGRNIED